MTFRFILSLIILTVCVAAKDGCATPPKKPDAKATPTATNPVPAAIEAEKKAVETAMKAVEKREAQVAASVVAAAAENTNQPPSQRTTFIQKELAVAITNLPPPDAEAALKAEQRRVATLSTNLALMEKLYGDADALTKRQAKEINEATNAIVLVQRALVAAEAKHVADLEANRAENQRVLDAAHRATEAAEAKAKAAKEEAYKERQNLLVRILIGIGGLCILAGIGLVIATSGASAWRSGIAVFCGMLCFGLAKVLSHPWFNIVFVVAIVLVVVAAGIYLWRERKHHTEAKALEKVVMVAENKRMIRDAEGHFTEFGAELRAVMDDAHKQVIKGLRKQVEVNKAKDELRAAKEGRVS